MHVASSLCTEPSKPIARTALTILHRRSVKKHTSCQTAINIDSTERGSIAHHSGSTCWGSYSTRARSAMRFTRAWCIPCCGGQRIRTEAQTENELVCAHDNFSCLHRPAHAGVSRSRMHTMHKSFLPPARGGLSSVWHHSQTLTVPMVSPSNSQLAGRHLLCERLQCD